METTITKPKAKKSYLVLLIIDILLALICIGIFLAGVLQQNYLISLEKKEAEYVAAMAKTAKEVDIATPLRVSTTKQVKKQQEIPAYSQSQLQKMDLRKPSGLTASDLKLVTSAGLVGLEDSFVKAEKEYGVNCLFLMSIASEESAKGTMMFRPNNMFGFGRSGFSSKSEGIQVVASTLSKKYLNPNGSLYGGSPTIGGVRQRYCTSTAWTGKVARYMAGYYSTISKSRDKALENLD